MKELFFVRFRGSCRRHTRKLPWLLAAGRVCTVLAIGGMPSHAAAQGTWQLQKIELVVDYGGGPARGEKHQTATLEPGNRGPFYLGWHAPRRGDRRTVGLWVSFPEWSPIASEAHPSAGLPQTLRQGDRIDYYATVTTELKVERAWGSKEPAGLDTAYLFFYGKVKTVSGYEENAFARRGSPPPGRPDPWYSNHKIGAGNVGQYPFSTSLSSLSGSYPLEDFTVSLGVRIDDGGPRWHRESDPPTGDLTLLLHYRWMGETPVVAQNQSGGMGPREDNTVLTGTTLKFYRQAYVDQCQSDCANNPDCKGFSWIKAGTYNAGDPAMCYLLSVVARKTPAGGHVSAVKTP